MKVCGKCKIEKPLEDFAKNRAKRDGLQGICRLCKKLVDHNHHKVNKLKQQNRNKINLEKYKQVVRDIKNVPCMDCKQNYPYYVMDFDHVRGIKQGNISLMIGRVSNKALMEEIAKCDIICSNCHRERTFSRVRNSEAEYSALTGSVEISKFSGPTIQEEY